MSARGGAVRWFKVTRAPDVTEPSAPWWRHPALAWAASGGSSHAWSLSPWCQDWGRAAPASFQTSASVVVLSVSWRKESSPGKASAVMWSYGTVWLIGATGWSYVSSHRYGELPGWSAAAAVVALCAALSLYMASVGWG
ncbi:hypothetical protein OY671_011506, partial [Metschnikowia pulcherrima]